MTRYLLRIAGWLLVTTMLAPAVSLAADQGKGLTRFATVPLGAEITGLLITDDGDLFFNAQHPADSNEAPNNRATIGALAGVNMNELPASFEPVKVPESAEEKQGFLTALGSYEAIAHEGDFADTVKGGLGGIVTADGQSVIKQSNDPDFNGFIAEGDGKMAYLFTNWEDRPGAMSRLQIAKGDDGKWSVTEGDAMMVDFSPVNGTWVNCFGSVSPWGTPLTSEELYFDDTAD